MSSLDLKTATVFGSEFQTAGAQRRNACIANAVVVKLRSDYCPSVRLSVMSFSNADACKRDFSRSQYTCYKYNQTINITIVL